MARKRGRPVGDLPAETRGHDLIVIGASAGGIDAVGRLIRGLPAGLPATVFVVIHIAADSPGALPALLERGSALPVSTAVHRAPLRASHVYVAPPDHHLVVDKDRMLVVRGPKENRHRPAVDVLFRSAAWHHGPRVLAVVLTGNLDDGTAGLWAVKECGGIAIVQDPADAASPGMPLSALSHVDVDHCLPLDEIPRALIRLVSQVRARKSGSPSSVQVEEQMSRGAMGMDLLNGFAKPSVFSCPICQGALWEIEEGNLTRYRCHTGHAFGSASLLASQDEDTDHALNVALRSLRERSTAPRRVAEGYSNGHESLRERYLTKAHALERSAEVLRKMMARSS